jgi:predicted HTH transcriptional regulator
MGDCVAYSEYTKRFKEVERIYRVDVERLPNKVLQELLINAYIANDMYRRGTK